MRKPVMNNRVAVVFDDELINRIKTFQTENEFQSLSVAIRTLILAALEDAPKISLLIQQVRADMIGVKTMILQKAMVAMDQIQSELAVDLESSQRFDAQLSAAHPRPEEETPSTSTGASP